MNQILGSTWFYIAMGYVINLSVLAFVSLLLFYLFKGSKNVSHSLKMRLAFISLPVILLLSIFTPVVQAAGSNAQSIGLLPSGAVIFPSGTSVADRVQAGILYTYFGNRVGICDNADDDVQVIAAKNAINAGDSIQIRQGTLTFGGKFLIDKQIRLYGQGEGSVITLATAVTSLLTGNAGAAQADIAVTSSTGLSIGDTIILIDDNGFGVYKLSNVVGNTLTASRNLGQAYNVADNAAVWLIYPLIDIEASGIEIDHIKFDGNRANRMNGLAATPIFGARAGSVVYTDSACEHGEADGVIQIGWSATVSRVRVHDIWMDEMPSHGIFPALATATGIGDVTVDHCRFTNIGDKALVAVNIVGAGYFRQLFFDDNIIDGTGKAVLFEHADPAQSGWGDGVQGHSNAPNEFYVRRNRMSDIGRYGVYITTAAAPSELSIVRIEDNSIWKYNALVFDPTLLISAIYSDSRANVDILRNFMDAESLANYGVLVISGSKVRILENVTDGIPGASDYSIRTADTTQLLIAHNTDLSGCRIAPYTLGNDTTILANYCREIYVGSGGVLTSNLQILDNNLTYRIRLDLNAAGVTGLIAKNNILTDISFAGSSASYITNSIIVANIGYIEPGEVRVASGILTAGNANAIFFAWHNPEVQDILIKKVVIEITTPGGTALSVGQVGIADDAAGTNLGTEFFPAAGIDLNTAAIYDSWNAADTGVQTKFVLCQDSVSATDGWIVGQILVQNAAALAGRYYIEYIGR